VWLVDMLSRGGTLLNGTPVPWAPLADGDELQVGVFRVRVQCPSRAAKEERALCTVEGPAAGEALAGPGSAPSLPALPVAGATGQESHALLPIMQQFNLMQQQMFDQFHQTMLLMFRTFTAMHQDQAALIREELQHIQKTTEELHTLQRQLSGAAPGRSQPIGPPPEGAPYQGERRTEADEASNIPLASPGANEDPTPAALPGADGDVHGWLSHRIEELQAEQQTRWQRILSFLRGS
jgi:hypothetical protein